MSARPQRRCCSPSESRARGHSIRLDRLSTVQGVRFVRLGAVPTVLAVTAATGAALSSAAVPPQGCSLHPLIPEVRHGQMAGLGTLLCNHAISVELFPVALQRQAGSHWKTMKGFAGNTGFRLPAGKPFRTMTTPEACRAGVYRSQLFLALADRQVTRSSPSVRLTCAG